MAYLCLIGLTTLTITLQKNRRKKVSEDLTWLLIKYLSEYFT